MTVELFTDCHVLIVGIAGSRHRASVRVDGMPDWTGLKGPGAGGFFQAAQPMKSRHAAGDNTTLALMFGRNALEGLIHHAKPMTWRSQADVHDAFVAASAAELAVALREREDDLAALRAETIATSLQLHVADRFSDARHPPPVPGDRIGRALEYIHACLPRAATLNALVDVSELPRGSLIKAFKERTGLTPHQYIIRERLRRARLLLSSTSRSLAEIAHEVGCAGPEHLSHMFRQHLGMCPRTWRRINHRG